MTSRESSLFIFHALGKVLYNKRPSSLSLFSAPFFVLTHIFSAGWGDTVEDDKKDLNRPGILQDREYEKLPKHLRKSGIGRRASKVDPDVRAPLAASFLPFLSLQGAKDRDEGAWTHAYSLSQVLFAEAPLDPDIFLSYLHHNYPPFTNDIEECVGILEGLSTGDAMMLPKGSGAGEGEDVRYFLSSLPDVLTLLHTFPDAVSASVQAYRRSALTANYAFHLSTRSTLLSLPSPVPRRKQVLRKSELWQTVRLARQNEEGVAELLGLAGGQSSLNLSGTAGLVYAGCQREEEEEGGLVTRREGGSLLSEVVPWLGVIKPESASTFLSSAFPSSCTPSSVLRMLNLPCPLPLHRRQRLPPRSRHIPPSRRLPSWRHWRRSRRERSRKRRRRRYRCRHSARQQPPYPVVDAEQVLGAGRGGGGAAAGGFGREGEGSGDGGAIR